MLAKEHFGNPLIEQRKLSAGEAFVVMNKQGIITIEGDDRLTWLHSLLSQDIKNLNAGESTEALLLDPQGHIEQVIKVIEDSKVTWLVVPQRKKQQLMDWLGKMVFRLKVSITDRSEDFAVVGAVKPETSLASTSNNHPLIWKDGWSGTAKGGFRYSTRSIHYSWVEHLVESNELETVLKGKDLAGTMAYQALRIAAARPDVEYEVDEKSLPHELDLLSTAVHLSKGCYRGQETVAKVHNLGHPPRRLTFLHLDGSDSTLPSIGDEVLISGDEKVRGKITSVAQHFEMGPIALALISRNVPEDCALEVRGATHSIAATQEIVVPASAGAVAELPKLNRLNLSSRPK